MRAYRKKSLLLAGSVIAAGSLLPTTSYARENASEQGETTDSNVIVVTAQKRSQSIQNVPASISAVGSKDLSEKGIDDLTELQFAVPSLQFGGFLGSQNISIRGVGEFNDQPGVAVSFDGVYQSRGTTAQLSQLDLERVEVLRGPQGTLYGRNATGGVVNFVSAKPTDELEGYLKLGYAEFDEIRVEGVLNIPITDGTSFRVAANYTDIGNGWIENQVPGQPDLQAGEFFNLRARLNSQITDNFNLDLVYARGEIHGPVDHYAFLTDNRALAIAAGIPQLANAQLSVKPFEQFSDTPNDSDRVYQLFSATAELEMPFATLRSITAYQEYDNDRIDDRDATNLPIFQASRDSKTKTFSQELNLIGNSDAVEWVVGLFYLDDKFRRRDFFTNDLPVLGFPLPSNLDYTQPFYKQESKAAFADALWNITERLKVGGGIRYTKDEISEAHTIEFFVRTPAPVSIGVLCNQQTNTSWDATTFRAIAQYETSGNSNVYASVSEGYKAGGTVQFECAQPYNPEYVTAYEFGYKGNILDGTTSLNASVFYYDYSDFQLTQIIGLTTSTINAGDAKIMGAELEINSQIDDNWAVNAALTLLDSEYGSFLNTDGLQPGLGAQQLKGKRLNGAPTASINFGLSYNTPLSIGGELTLRADASYRSRAYFREFNALEDSQSGYAVVNLNAIWESDDRKWAGRVFAKNLTNKAYVTGLVGSASNGGRLGSYGPPRQIGVELTRFFGAR